MALDESEALQEYYNIDEIYPKMLFLFALILIFPFFFLSNAECRDRNLSKLV